MKKVGILSAMALGTLAFLMVPMMSWAGGTVEGKVSFSGKPPAPKEFLFSKFPNPKFCVKNPNKDAKGEKRLLHEVEVGKDGALKNAVVAIEGINDEKFVADFKGQDIQAELCEFKPYTAVVVENQKSFRVVNTDEEAAQVEFIKKDGDQFVFKDLEMDPKDKKFKETKVKSLDTIRTDTGTLREADLKPGAKVVMVRGVLHNPHSFKVKGASSATIFNIGLSNKGDKLDKPLKPNSPKPGESIFRMQCDQHEFMQVWALPVTNPYYAVVGEDGKFEIKDIPPGKYKVVAWHPALNKQKPLEQEIEVKDGASASAKFEFKP
jgi:polysaccharide lyase family 4-like protein